MADENKGIGEADSKTNPEPALKSSEAEANCQDVDPELEDILDSALADFEKTTPSGATAAVIDGASAKLPSAEGGVQQEKMFEDLFSAGQTGDGNQQFDEAMKNIMGDESAFVQQLHKLAQAANNAEFSEDSEEAQQQFAETLQQTLTDLSQGSQELQGNISEEELLNAMQNMGMEDGPMGPEGLDFLPMMQDMMKNLLSKEVLYPSLKEISTKYPSWLEENKGKVAEDKYLKYSQQYDIMLRICAEFEEEQPEDSNEIKKQRFEKVVDLMHQMQECGQPPSEIVGEMVPGFEVDEHGNPKLPGNLGNMEQCSIM